MCHNDCCRLQSAPMLLDDFRLPDSLIFGDDLQLLLRSFEVEDVSQGLADRELIDRRLQQFGYNKIPEKTRKSWTELIYEQFDDSLVRILLVSGLLSAFIAIIESHTISVGILAEPMTILLILIINATIGVYQERKSEHNLESLKDYISDYSTVLRFGTSQTMPSSEIVPGDIIVLRSGEKVPADCRILSIKTNQLIVDESLLTGESKSVYKCAILNYKVNSNKIDSANTKINALYSGTFILSGSCTAVVIKTGTATEFGKISAMLLSADDDVPPLKLILDRFASALTKIIFGICILIWILNIHRFRSSGGNNHHSFIYGALYYFKNSISLAVAAIPEGLPTVITICLAIGTQNMAKKHAIIRKLSSVQALGAIDYLCTDKTGTLTSNIICSSSLFYFSPSNNDFKELSIDGHDYQVTKNSINRSEISLSDNEVFSMIANISVNCNDSNIDLDSITPKPIGSPTEASLLILAAKITQDILEYSNPSAQLSSKNCHDVIDSIKNSTSIKRFNEFERSRKAMSVVDSCGKVYFKGAPEIHLPR
ncbi:MAG: hypothetical protein MHMPM18_001571 [Marteilia pararefringens]